MREGLVASVILNWNNRDMLRACLESLRCQNYEPFVAIVVDQGSKDGSVEMVKEEFPEVILIENGRNVGHSKGNNIGIRKALQLGAEFVFLQDNDTEIAQDTLGRLVEVMREDEGIGIAGPVVYLWDRRDCVWSGGGRILPRTYQHLHMYEGAREEELPEERIWEAEFLPSCGALVRRKLFDDGLYFDEGMFVYHNDVDFCLKARRAGWKVVVVRDAKMWHKVSGTVGVYSPTMIYYKGRNKILLFRRYGKMRDLPYFVGFHLKKAFSIFKGRRSLRGVGAMMKAFFHGIRGVKN